MKKILFIFILALSFVSCNDKKPVEQKLMEEKISQVADGRSFTNFKIYKEKTMRDEIVEYIKLNEFYLNWHLSGIEAFEEALNDTNQVHLKDYNLERLQYHKEAAHKDSLSIAYGKEVMTKFPLEISTITFITYEMCYWYGEGENRDTELCFAMFNSNGDMVAFKPTAKAEWEILGDTTSIQNIYGSKL